MAYDLEKNIKNDKNYIDRLQDKDKMKRRFNSKEESREDKILMLESYVARAPAFHYSFFDKTNEEKEQTIKDLVNYFLNKKRQKEIFKKNNRKILV